MYYMINTIEKINYQMKNNRLVPLNNNYSIDYSAILGKGATGTVYTGYGPNNKVAIKVIDLNTVNTQIMKYLYKMETRALTLLNNSYLIKCFQILQIQSKSYIITELYKGPTLSQYIKQNGALSETSALQIIQCILKGYQQLLQKKIIHRDMKTDNIMLDNGTPKIIDFGYCEIQGYKKPNKVYNVGSPSYMSPQSYNCNIYNQKTQIWSIGAIFYECLSGKTLHQGQIVMEQAYRKLQNEGVMIDNVNKKIINLVNWCLNFNIVKRPTVRQLLTAVEQLKNQKLTSISSFKNLPELLSQKSIPQLSGKEKINKSISQKHIKIEDTAKVLKLARYGSNKIIQFNQEKNAIIPNIWDVNKTLKYIKKSPFEINNNLFETKNIKSYQFIPNQNMFNSISKRKLNQLIQNKAKQQINGIKYCQLR